MTKTQRLESILLALLMLCCVLILMIVPEKGKPVVFAIGEVTMLVSAVRYLVYYFTMARHMVGGKVILYKGLIYLDVGLVIEVMDDLPSAVVMLYLTGYFVMMGVFRLLKTMESKRLNASYWYWGLLPVAVQFLLAALCVKFLHSQAGMSYVVCIALFFSAITRIFRAFRKREVVFIQQ